MRTLKITNLNISHNAGINAEQSLRYFLHGYTTAHDSRRFDEASDIDNISVKSAHFTLVQGGLLNGSELKPMVDDYFSRVHSTEFAYVARDFTVYMMNAEEFREFLMTFGTVERDSYKNGGKLKVRARSESKRMVEWLNERAS